MSFQSFKKRIHSAASSARLCPFLRTAAPYTLAFIFILYGTFVTFSFLGADGHLPAMAENEAVRDIIEKVREREPYQFLIFFERGIAALSPFFTLLFTRLLPFLPYIICSLLLYGGAVLYFFLNKKKLYI